MRTMLLLGFVALCVTNVRANPRKEPAAVVLVIDRSGSMTGPKLAKAKEAVLAAIDALGSADRVSLVTFDSEPTIVFENVAVADRRKLKKQIADIHPGGGTNIYPGLAAASKILTATKQKQRHVVVMTDGEAPTDGIVELLSDMRVEGITVSAVGVPGADRTLLSMIADAGDGRLYMVDDIAALPKLFALEMKTALER